MSWRGKIVLAATACLVALGIAATVDGLSLQHRIDVKAAAAQACAEKLPSDNLQREFLDHCSAYLLESELHRHLVWFGVVGGSLLLIAAAAF